MRSSLRDASGQLPEARLGRSLAGQRCVVRAARGGSCRWERPPGPRSPAAVEWSPATKVKTACLPQLPRLPSLNSSANAAAPFPSRAGPTQSGAEAASGRSAGVRAARRGRPGPWALPRRGRGRADCEPNVEGGTSPEAAESPVLSQGATRPWVPSFFPRPRCLASRCSGTRREQRGAASTASGGVLTPPGGGLGASIPRTPDEGQNTSSPGGEAQVGSPVPQFIF